MKFFKILQNTVQSKLSTAESLDWILSQEVYEVLDTSVMDSIGFREFGAYIFLVSAAQDG